MGAECTGCFKGPGNITSSELGGIWCMGVLLFLFKM